jgi:hypothetical protein
MKFGILRCDEWVSIRIDNVVVYFMADLLPFRNRCTDRDNEREMDGKVRQSGSKKGNCASSKGQEV